MSLFSPTSRRSLQRHRKNSRSRALKRAEGERLIRIDAENCREVPAKLMFPYVSKGFHLNAASRNRFRDRMLKSGAPSQMVWVVDLVMMYSDSTGKPTWPSQQHLADFAQCSLSKVQRWISRAEKAGWIRVERSAPVAKTGSFDSDDVTWTRLRTNHYSIIFTFDDLDTCIDKICAYLGITKPPRRLTKKSRVRAQRAHSPIEAHAPPAAEVPVGGPEDSYTPEYGKVTLRQMREMLATSD